MKTVTLPVRAVLTAGMLGSALFAAGCMSSPTYGTDKTANAQLVDDVSNIFSPIPKSRKQINYVPRAELVKPADARNAPLPPPQDSVASTDNPDWVESPEARRARLRADATANRDNPNYRPSIVNDVSVDGPERAAPNHNYDAERAGAEFAKAGNQGKQFKERLKETQQGSPTVRKTLSEPPLVYRQPAADAPVGDLGEPEYKKEARLKKEARKKSGKSGWRGFIPGL